ncbi:MAG: UvrD-helicase domain-containing protein [Candidatus Paceibacterota bacterium]|jgi:DNA helicase-2/ATP-dependent DNA helicase PcrA
MKKDELNQAQMEAVAHKEGPILIVAGAGAGKTKTISERIITLINGGVLPNQILAITFTNKAAKEMKDRVEATIKREREWAISFPLVSTFHSLGVKILKDNHEKLGLTKYFSILDENDSVSIVKEAIKQAGLDPKQFEPRKMKNIISREKGNFVTLEDYENDTNSYVRKIVAIIWRIYEEKLKKEKSLDFDDLLLKTVLLLKKNKNILEQYQDKWQYIHIDEYQDTNAVQYELSKLLAEKNKNICVVGDSDQNIYSWRGANIQNILNFEKDYPGAKVILLEENYRSTKNILEAANEVIKKNSLRKEKNLFTKNKEGEKISLFEAYDEKEEASFVSEKIDELLEKNVSPKEIAVLYRANFQSRVLEETMLDKNIPYQVLGVKFFERKEIKDVLSYLKASFNKESLSDIKRIINVPARGIGKTTLLKLFADKFSELPKPTQEKVSSFYKLLEKIKDFALENKPSEIIKFIIKETKIEETLRAGTEEDLERLENIKELVTLAIKYDEMTPPDGIDKLLEDAALASEQDSLIDKNQKQNSNSVKLMTVHASKGLEFSYVFITGLEQDLFPHKKESRDASSKDLQEEERRLFYVAITRAKEKVFLSYAGIRTLFGMRQMNTPSEFLYDIPEYLVEKEERLRPFGNTRKIIFLD